MISESYPWKKELLKISKSLKKRFVQKRWTIKSSFLFEKEIFISFYIVRKLIEAEKISTINKKIQIPCYMIPSVGKNVIRFNTSSCERLFDFEKTKKGNIKISELCNQVIHSYIFDAVFDTEHQIAGFWVASDWKRHTTLYSFLLEDLIKLFELIGNDYPNFMITTYNNEKRDYEINQSVVLESEQQKYYEAIQKINN